VAVLGPSGAGSSTIAMAVAQGLGSDARYAGSVLLADLALDADLAFLHDVGDVVPGLPELVEAHRLGVPHADEVDGLLHAIPSRGYALLLGIRRHRDWASLRPRAFDAAFTELRRRHRVVVTDVDADFEGVDECGSIEVEERNMLARTAVDAASTVVVVGSPSAKGVHSLVRILHLVLGRGVQPRSIVTVLNRSPRSLRSRAALVAALAALLPSEVAGLMGSPVFVPDRRRMDEVVRDAAPMPSALVGPVQGVVLAQLDGRVASERPPPEAAAVEPGSLGHWFDEDVVV
jgi:hypothetical protein